MTVIEEKIRELSDKLVNKIDDLRRDYHEK